MRKLNLIFGAMLLLLVGAVSAIQVPLLVAGTIYESDHTTEVSGADVEAVCDDVTLTTTSEADGDYEIDFTDTACSVGDTVVVTATKGGASGTESDTVENYTYIELAIVNVSIPEFGAIAASLALVGSGFGYLFIRKRK